MSEDDFRDQLIDTLLWEELGGEHCAPDMVGRVLTTARSTAARTMVWWKPALALAASLVVAMGGWLLLKDSYPDPMAIGEFTVVGNGPVCRGAVLNTETGTATITLGGYCELKMDEHTTVRIEGTKGNERVALVSGYIYCSIKKDKGEFAVGTELGDVSVVGTVFTVHMMTNPSRAMVVRVRSGEVKVTRGAVTTVLKDGERHCFVDGVDSRNMSVESGPAGEERWPFFALRRNHEGQDVPVLVGTLSGGFMTAVEDGTIDEGNRMLHLAPKQSGNSGPVDRGVIVGTITALSSNSMDLCLERRGSDLILRHFAPTSGEIAGLSAVAVGDFVALSWRKDDKYRALRVEKLQPVLDEKELQKYMNAIQDSLDRNPSLKK